jgi:ribonuclease-3
MRFRDEIEKKLGYTFRDERLLDEAFTHVTYANKHGGVHNDRMEYLGDAVLQLVVTNWQYARNDKATAGKLTAERQKLVCQNALDSAIDALDVWQYLLYEGTEQNLQGKPKSSLFEAIVAAIYLDGGYKAAETFIVKHGNLSAGKAVDNPKGDLKEFLEKRGEEPPRYETVKTGKDHAPMFYTTAYALGESAKGEGKSKKDAESLAAARLLWELTKSKKKN